MAVSILISALATLSATLFMEELIDSYIVPLLGMAAPDFGPLAERLLSLAAVLAAGILCSYAYSRRYYVCLYPQLTRAHTVRTGLFQCPAVLLFAPRTSSTRRSSALQGTETASA